MRIIQISTAPPFGCRRVEVVWDDGSSTSEPVPPTVTDAQVRRWLESRRGKGVRAWHGA